MKIDAKNKEKTILLFTSLILISLGLMGLDKLGWLNWLKRPMEKLINPAREKIYQQNSKIPKLQNSKGSDLVVLQEELEEVERENAGLKVKLKGLEQENAAMKRLLGAPLSPAWKFIPAKVISVRDGIMTVNQGLDVGIKQGDVVVFENVLVGRIIKVNPFLSKIKLVVNKNTSIKVEIMEINSKGVVKLEANNVLILDGVLQEVLLSKEQIIITSGEDEIYPPDLLIGKIDSIEKNETSIYQKAILKPFLDYKILKAVFIVKI